MRHTLCGGQSTEMRYVTELYQPLFRTAVSFELNQRHDIDGDVAWNLARRINHSCGPNCETQNIRGHIWVVACRDIAPGEELTYDYGFS